MSNFLNPSKLCLVILIEMFLSEKLPHHALLPILRFLARNLTDYEPPPPEYPPDHLLVFNKVKATVPGPLRTYPDLWRPVQTEASMAISLREFQNLLMPMTMPLPVPVVGFPRGHFGGYTAWVNFLWRLAVITDLDRLNLWLMSDVDLQVVPLSFDPAVIGESYDTAILARIFSPVATFLITCREEWSRLSLREVSDLWDQLEAYRQPVLWTGPGPLAMPDSWEMDWIKARTPARYFGGDPGGDPPAKRPPPALTVDTATLLLDFQVGKMASYGIRPPARLIRTIRQYLILHSCRQYPASTHYLDCLDAWRQGDHLKAEECLHRYFDLAASPITATTKTFPDCQLAGQTMLYFANMTKALIIADFGLPADAVTAMLEAVIAAREAQDDGCLDTMLNWLYRFADAHPEVRDMIDAQGVVSEDPDGCIEYLVCTTAAKDMWALHSAAILESARVELAVEHDADDLVALDDTKLPADKLRDKHADSDPLPPIHDSAGLFTEAETENIESLKAAWDLEAGGREKWDRDTDPTGYRVIFAIVAQSEAVAVRHKMYTLLAGTYNIRAATLERLGLVRSAHLERDLVRVAGAGRLGGPEPVPRIALEDEVRFICRRAQYMADRGQLKSALQQLDLYKNAAYGPPAIHKIEAMLQNRRDLIEIRYMMLQRDLHLDARIDRGFDALRMCRTRADISEPEIADAVDMLAIDYLIVQGRLHEAQAKVGEMVRIGRDYHADTVFMIWLQLKEAKIMLMVGQPFQAYNLLETVIVRARARNFHTLLYQCIGALCEAIVMMGWEEGEVDATAVRLLEEIIPRAHETEDAALLGELYFIFAQACTQYSRLAFYPDTTAKLERLPRDPVYRWSEDFDDGRGTDSSSEPEREPSPEPEPTPELSEEEKRAAARAERHRVQQVSREWNFRALRALASANEFFSIIRDVYHKAEAIQSSRRVYIEMGGGRTDVGSVDRMIGALMVGKETMATQTAQMHMDLWGDYISQATSVYVA